MCSESKNIMWGISDVCTLARTVAKTSSHDGNISGPKGPRGTRGNGDISEVRFILYILFLVLDPN